MGVYFRGSCSSLFVNWCDVSKFELLSETSLKNKLLDQESKVFAVTGQQSLKVHAGIQRSLSDLLNLSRFFYASVFKDELE